LLLQAFPLRSPLVAHVSRAILKVTEDKDKMTVIWQKYFASKKTICQDRSAEHYSDSLSLGVHSFGGLFIITIVASMFSLLIYMGRFLHLQWPAPNTIPSQGSLWLRLVELAKHFGQRDLSLHPFRRNNNESTLNHPEIASSDDSLATSPSIYDIQNHSRTFNERDDNAAVHEDDQIFSSGRHSDASANVPA